MVPVNLAVVSLILFASYVHGAANLGPGLEIVLCVLSEFNE